MMLWRRCTGIFIRDRDSVMERIKFLNIYIDNMTMSEVIAKIDELIQERRCAYVVTPNLDHIVIMENDEEFFEIYQNANLIVTDGKPLIWISRFLGNPIKEKISGSDLFPKMCEMAARCGYSIYILGAAEGVADIAAENLRKKNQGLKIVGTYSPPIGFENDDDELDIIKKKVIDAHPDILAVALGSPKGEKFIYRHLEDLGVPLSISIGATIDFEAGIIRRAPKWIAAIGFEWLFRITQDPRRLIKRYCKDAIRIIPIISKYK